MAKPSPRKPQTKAPAAAPRPAATSKITKPANRWLYAMALFIGVAGFLIYSNTLNHEYVLDDFSVIKENVITRGGTESIGKIFTTSYRGGQFGDESGLYRPLSRVMFAVEWEIAPENPAFSHWINALMYAFTCGFLFIVLYGYLKPNYIVPFLAALIFTFHPLHTEVVANIKSRDEIMGLLFILLSLWSLKRYVDRNSIPYLALAAFSFFLSLLSKESSITYLAVAPLTVWFFTSASVRKNVIATGSMAAVVIVYLFIHYSVIGNIGVSNVPVVDNSLMATDSVVHRKATAIYILGLYLKLLFFPHPLSCDYSYNAIPLVTSLGDPRFVVPLLAHMALVGIAIWQFRRKSLISYGIIFYFVTLSIGSNIVVTIGTNMAERLLFTPSVGFAIVVGAVLVQVFKFPSTAVFPGWMKMLRQGTGMFALLGVVLLLFSVKTMSRNRDWRNVSTLFRQDVKTVPNSAHMQLYYAGMITNVDSLAEKNAVERNKTLLEAIQHLQKAVEIYEPFPDAHNQLGKAFKELNNFPEAEKHYKRSIELAGSNATYHNNLATVYFSTGQYQEAEKAFRQAIELNKEEGCYSDALSNLGSVYGTYGEISRSKGDEAGARKNFEESIRWFREALECDPEYPNALLFLAATYRNMGNEAEAQVYQQKYERVMAKKKKKTAPGAQ